MKSIIEGLAAGWDAIWQSARYCLLAAAVAFGVTVGMLIAARTVQKFAPAAKYQRVTTSVNITGGTK